MSEVLKNKYLDFTGLSKYDELIKAFIASGNKELADAITALNDKIGSLDIEGSDDKTLSELVSEIYTSIEGLKDSLESKDAEIEEDINGIIEDINGIVGDLDSLEGSDAVMTLVEVSNKLKALEGSVSKNTEDITKVTERVVAVEEAIKNLGEIEGGESLGEIVSEVKSNTAAIETLRGEGVGSVKKTAQDAADAAQSAAQAYADGLASNYDAAGSAATALENAQAYVDAIVNDTEVDGETVKGLNSRIADLEAIDNNQIASDAAAEALEDAKEYADSLVKDAEGNSLFDAAGSAATAESNAKTYAKEYADSLATNYDAVGAADAAKDAAIADAAEKYQVKGDYEIAGAAATAEQNAKDYADEKTGANAELIEGLSGRIGSLEGIAHAANVVYNEDTKFINIVDKDGNVIGNGFDASPFIVDGMLDGVAFEEVEGVKTNNLVFTFNTSAGKENVVVDFTKYVDIYQGDGSSIELNSETKTFSIKEVDASKTKLSTSIEVNGGPLADDANDNWPWTENGVKVIPAGKSMEEILTSLFLKVTNGTVVKGSINWSPSLSAPTVSITKSGTVEVGTKLTATANTTSTVSNNSRTCTFTCNKGHFLSTGTDENGKLIFGSHVSGNKTVTANAVNPAYDGTSTIKTYWNGTEVTNVNGETEYTVSIVGTNTFKVDQSGITAYAGAFDDITVYGSTNTKVPVETVKASITNDTAPAAKPLTSTNSATVTGARAYWMGAMANPLSEFTSASIREAGENSESGLTKTLSSSPATTLTVPAGEYDVVIATQKEISAVTSAAQFGSAITGNFTANHSEVNIEGANGFTAIKYHVYHCNANWDDDTLTITYK